MDRIQWQRLGSALKIFLLSRKSRELLVFAFFVCVSAGFWLIQTLNDTYNMEVQIPIALSNVPSDVIVTDELPSPVRVTLRDKGMSLFRYYRSAVKELLQVDFKNYIKNDGVGYGVVSRSELQKLLTGRLLSSSQIVAIHPDTIDYYYSRGVKKRVPVVLDGQVEANPLYYISDVHCVPESVTVWAPAALMDSLVAAHVDVSLITGLTHNDQRMLQLADTKGIKFEPAQVQVSSQVDMYTEKSVNVPITGLNFPGDKALITFPATAEITFRVGTKLYKKITADDFVVAVTYEELLQNPGSSSFKLHVRSVPDGVSQVRISPETVDYLIEQTGE